eukprot:scaffold117632_cov20-Tisochrysis_lutea.AAC.1
MWALLLASGGLGYATTRKLAENGAQVFMVSRSLANGKAAAAKMEAECGMPLQLHVLECDFRELRCALLEVLRKRAMDLCNCKDGSKRFKQQSNKGETDTWID